MRIAVGLFHVLFDQSERLQAALLAERLRVERNARIAGLVAHDALKVVLVALRALVLRPPDIEHERPVLGAGAPHKGIAARLDDALAELVQLVGRARQAVARREECLQRGLVVDHAAVAAGPGHGVVLAVDAGNARQVEVVAVGGQDLLLHGLAVPHGLALVDVGQLLQIAARGKSHARRVEEVEIVGDVSALDHGDGIHLAGKRRERDVRALVVVLVDLLHLLQILAAVAAVEIVDLQFGFPLGNRGAFACTGKEAAAHKHTDEQSHRSGQFLHGSSLFTRPE